MQYVSLAAIILLLLLDSAPIEAKEFPRRQRHQHSPTRTDRHLSTKNAIRRPAPSTSQSAQDGPIPARSSTDSINGEDKKSASMPTTTVFLSSARAATNRIFTPERGSTLKNSIQSAKDRFHYAMKYKMQASRKKNMGLATNLSGGADVEENSNMPSSTQSSASAAFLGTLRHKKKNLLPNLSKANEATLRNVKKGMNKLQAKGAQVTPSIVTFLSVLWTADKGVSFFSLYALALLGASCGFHLFLYFITVGYAVGITLPLAVALKLYKVCGFFQC